MTTEALLQVNVAAPAPAKSIARHAPTVGRVLLGLAFLVFGLDGFLHFFPRPTDPMPEAVMAFAGGLMKSGYMFPLINGTEVLVGALLLSNLFVPLALILLAPITVNILAFHCVLAPSGIAPGAVLAALQLGLAWSYRKAYLPLLRARTVR